MIFIIGSIFATCVCVSLYIGNVYTRVFCKVCMFDGGGGGQRESHGLKSRTDISELTSKLSSFTIPYFLQIEYMGLGFLKDREKHP